MASTIYRYCSVAVWDGLYVLLWDFLDEVIGGPSDLHSFPTRRSSDLCRYTGPAVCQPKHTSSICAAETLAKSRHAKVSADRKSTRLNSSHVSISYAVFCLKKKINSLLPRLIHQPKRLPYPNSTHHTPY